MTDLAKNEIKHARAIAGQIREGIHNYLTTLSLIRRAYEERHWNVLGYESWQEYVDTEFGADRLRIPAEHRQKAVQELRLAGMSQRSIAPVVGVSEGQVRRDLAEVRRGVAPDHIPPTVLGADGKAYTTPEPPARRDPEPTSGGPAIATTDGPDPTERPPAWDPAERRAHEEDVARRRDIEAARRAAATIVTTVRTEVVTVVTGCRYGERGLVSKQMVADLRSAIDLLEGEIDGAE